MGEQKILNYRRIFDAPSRLAKGALQAAETGVKLPLEIGKFATDLSVQIVQTARAGGVPLPAGYAERIKRRDAKRERDHHEETASLLGDLLLKATNQDRRHVEYAVKPEQVIGVLAPFCEETGVKIEEVMDPFAGPLVKDLLENNPPME